MPTKKNKRRPDMSNLWPWQQMNINQKSTAPAMPEFYQTMLQMGQEYIDLCTQRTKAYSELQREVSECQSPEDIEELRLHFWNEAYHQYRDFSSHTMPGPLAIFGGIIDGQVANTVPGNSRTSFATTSASTTKSRTGPKTPSRTRAKAGTKRKSPARRKPSENERGLYSYPEHVEGRHENRGRIH